MSLGITMSLDIVNYRPSWQRLRCSTLKEHNPYGGMATVDGSTDAIMRMWNYINDATPQVNAQYTQEEISRANTTLDVEHACRVYRVYQFLQATVNGLASQRGLAHLNDIRAHIKQLQSQVDLSLVTKAANSWNWQFVQYELEQMFISERYWFIAIRDDMTERVVEKNKTGTEMTTFIAIMDEVNRIAY